MNEIGNMIASTEEGKAKYDETLKELFSNRQFLARILKRFVSEFADYPLSDIEDTYIEAGSISVSKTGVERNRTNIDGVSNEDKTLNEGNIFYDIIFRACYPGKGERYIGMYINLEIQNAYHTGYDIEARGMYYAARRLSSQLKSIRKDTDYRCLEKVYSIWICMGDVPDYEANTATLYRTEKYDMIGTVERGPERYDLINVVILRINDRTEPGDSVLRLLQVVCSNLIPKAEKLALIQDYGIRIDDEVRGGVERLCNISDLIEARAMERGIERGIEQGEAQAKKAVTLAMIRDDIPYEKIAQYTQTPLEIIEQWGHELSVAVQ